MGIQREQFREWPVGLPPENIRQTEQTMKAKEAKYEEDILASFERGEWESVPDLKGGIARYAASAAATLTKDKRINTRLP